MPERNQGALQPPDEMLLFCFCRLFFRFHVGVPVDLFAQQVLHVKAEDHLVAVEPALAVSDAVALAGVEVELEFLTGFLIFLSHDHGVGQMDVVVHGAVSQEQFALEVGCKVDRSTFLVAFGVALGSIHVAFCVDAVIEAPVGDGRAGHAELEGVGGFVHGHQGHVAAVAVAFDRDFAAINPLVSFEPVDAGDIVGEFVVTKILMDYLHEVATAVVGATVGHVELDDSFLGPELLAWPVGETVGNAAATAGAAIDADHDRIFFVLIEVVRFDHRDVKIHFAVITFDFVNFGHAVVVVLEAGHGAVAHEPHLLAVDVAELCHGWSGEVAVGVDIEVAHESLADTMRAFALAELGFGAVCDVYLVDMAFQRADFCRGIEDMFLLAVEAGKAGDVPFAFGELFFHDTIGFVEVDMAIAGAIGRPDEVVVINEMEVITDINPGRILFLKDGFHSACGRVGKHQVHHGLIPVFPVEPDSRGIGQPADAGDVGIFLFAVVDPGGAAAVDADNAQRYGGVGVTRLGILLFFQGVDHRQMLDDGEGFHCCGVELQVGDSG